MPKRHHDIATHQARSPRCDQASKWDLGRDWSNSRQDHHNSATLVVTHISQLLDKGAWLLLRTPRLRYHARLKAEAMDAWSKPYSFFQCRYCCRWASQAKPHKKYSLDYLNECGTPQASRLGAQTRNEAAYAIKHLQATNSVRACSEGALWSFDGWRAPGTC